MKKTFFIVITSLSFVFGLFGGKADPKAVVLNQQICETNAFRISRHVDDEGKIYLSYCFPVNSSFMQESGFSDVDINTFKFYLTIYVNALAKSNRDREIEGVSVGGCAYFSKYDALGFTIVFDNLELQKKFFNVEDSSSSSSQSKSSGFFIKKLEIETAFPISSSKSAEDVEAICIMATNSWCNDNGISDEKKNIVIENFDKAIFVYDFASVNDDLKSDVMYSDENGCHNVFIKTKSEIEDNNKICFWITMPNRPVWYLSALFVVLIAVLVAVFAVKREKN